MFAAAYAIARNYTFPIVISTRNFKGDCGSGIGTGVAVNNQGWCVTAFHILDQIRKLNESFIQYNSILAKRQAVENDGTLSHGKKMQQLGLLKIPPNQITNFSVWLGVDGAQLGEALGIEAIDLAVFRIPNFNSFRVATYPKFKDPNRAMEPGVSLCKLGYPFQSIIPTFDIMSGNFSLPAGSIPIPLFPIEGIFTRNVLINEPAPGPHVPRNYPLSFIETSSPGLRGQSGGPTFDVQGTIWAIQSRTQHYPLGFGDGNALPPKELEHLKNQYLNVGWGIHSATLTGFFRENNISFDLSSY